MDLNLEGKRAFVCGSTQGIGKATALELALLGASVTLCARSADKLNEVKEELDRSVGQVHDILVADFSKPNELDKSLNQHLDSSKPYHILINNTGGPPGGQAIDADLEEFRIAFNQHLICNQILAKALVPQMKSESYGRIINVISTSVKVPIQGLGVSNTIRGAVANWSKTLSNELGQFGITVNNVLPGATKTQRLTSIVEGRSQKFGKTIEEIEDQWKLQIPARRFAEADEVANAIAFLASPAASYINGINVPVDGGRTGAL